MDKIKLPEREYDSASLDDVIAMAKIIHAGDKRRGGEDYFTAHLEPVAKAAMKRASRTWISPHLKQVEMVGMVGYLHDALEDHIELSRFDLLKAGVPTVVVNAVSIITKDRHEDYIDYIKGVRDDKFAKIVKIADILHNFSDEPTIKAEEKYAKALMMLIHF